eukprot:s216_g23.t1
MLLRRATMWKAVGLTAAAVRLAQKPQFDPLLRRGSGGPRHRQGGETDKRTSRQDDMPGTGQCSGSHHPKRECRGGGMCASFNKCSHEARAMDGNPPQEPTDKVWNLTELDTLEGWHRYLKQRGGSETGSDQKRGEDRPRSSEEDKKPPTGAPDETPSREGGSGGNGRGDKDNPEDNAPGTTRTPLRFAPVCCSCTRNGVHAVRHEQRIEERTFRTRPIDERDQPTLLGLCLAPWTQGSIWASDGRVCGHTPCPDCTVQHDGQTMCRCCATRAQAQGTQFHGSGPLPPRIPQRQQPPSRAYTRPPDRRDRDNPNDRRSRTPATERSGRRRREEEGARRSPTRSPRRAPRRLPQPRGSQPPPTSEGAGERAEKPHGGGPGRRSREDRREAEPDHRNREGHRGEEPDRRSQQEPRPEQRDKDRADPLEEEEDDYVEEEEEEEPYEDDGEVLPEDRREDRQGRSDAGAREPARGWRDDRPGERRTSDQCQTPGCNRKKRYRAPTCCEQCYHSRGKQHNRYCGDRRGPPPREGQDRHWPDRDHDPDNEQGKGGPKGKGKPYKTPGKAARDRDRKRDWQQRGWKGGGQRWSFPASEYQRILKTGLAKSTLRSRQTRLSTWDGAMATLEAQEAISPLDEQAFLTPERARAGAALLRARGYRSAELYLGAAMARHRAMFPMTTQLEMAAKDASRIAKRGRGPAQGKTPVPIPRQGQYEYAALMTGVWYLLRVSELRALNVADVKVRWSGTGKWQLAIEIASSKTDQEGEGVTVARDCVCPAQAESDLCPVHILWRHTLIRKDHLRDSGTINTNAPLFTGDMGARITEARILAAIEDVARDAGEPLEERGVRRFGTHSMRVAGALWAFRAGVSEETVRALGRWKSTAAMLAYLRGTPLVRAAGASTQIAAAMGAGDATCLAAANFRPLLEVFDILLKDLEQYLWHRDRFILEPSLEEVPHLTGHLRIGDGTEDEWFVVHLLRKLSLQRDDVSCRVVDADGELLLIEAALATPRWVSPNNAENRCWIRKGLVHLLPKPQAGEPVQLSRREGLLRLRASGEETVARGKMQKAIEARLQGYPKRAIELSRHVVRAVLPESVARLLVALPQLISVIVDHLPSPPTRELLRLRRDLPENQSAIHFDCENLGEEETVLIGVRFTRLQYARLISLRCQVPQRFSRKRWKPPKGVKDPSEKAMQLGAMLCAGLEAAYLQGTQSATAVLRWREVPETLPWASDSLFQKQLRSELLKAISARRAYAQQADLEEHFREAYIRAVQDPTLKAVDLEAHWRDRDDPEDWLQVSQEDLDREMKVRQAEFEEFDQKRQPKSEAKKESTEKESDSKVFQDETILYHFLFWRNRLIMARRGLVTLLCGLVLLRALTFVSFSPALRVQRSVKVLRQATATDDTMTKVADVIAEQLGVEKDKVTREATLTELGADSLDIVESVMALEEAFDIELPDEEPNLY